MKKKLTLSTKILSRDLPKQSFNLFHFRHNSRNEQKNSNVIVNHRSGNAINVETYTELGNAVSGESENQYESISRQENYINTNVL